MFITKVVSKGKNGKSYTSILLRQSVRVGSKVKSKTLAVLTHLPPHVLAAVRRAIAQPANGLCELADASEGSLRLRHGQSFGAVWVVDQIAQQLGIKQALEAAVRKANKYLEEHPRAKVDTQRKHLAARLASLQVQDWLQLTVNQRRLVLTLDAPALQADAQLDGCYVVETDLKTTQADAQTVHDRYKDLALVERDFRTLKTGHLEFRPWFVCTEDNTQAHALSAMMALKVRRYLERAWWPLEVTVEEGLLELEQLSIMELVHSETGKVVTRQMPEPNARQKQLLDALGLTVPSKVPEAKVTVVTRKKIARVRKTLAK